MQDSRIKLLSLVTLSIAAFISTLSVIFVFLWWLILTDRKTTINSVKSAGMILLLPFVASVMIYINGGDYIGYFFKIAMILFIASWAYAKRRPGELLDVSVWAFGRKIGFDLGLVAELSITAIEVLSDDMKRMKFALAQKETSLGAKTLAPVITSLLTKELNNAGDRAIILAMRGYTTGGSLNPSFVTTRRDIIAGIAAMLILIRSLLPFILIEGI